MPSLTIGIGLLVWLAVLVLIVVLGVFFHRRGERKKLERATAWMTAKIEKAERGDTDVQYAISRNQISWPALLDGNTGLKARYDTQGEKGRQWHEAEQVQEELRKFKGRKHLDTWLDETERPELRLAALQEFHSLLWYLKYDSSKRYFLLEALQISPHANRRATKVSCTRLERKFKAMRNLVCRRLYKQFAATAGESAVDFRALQQVITLANCSPLLKRLKLPYPFHWNKWVLRHIEVPAFTDFVDQPSYPDVPRGTISLRMARALSTQDALELAITLSYCHNSSTCHKEVGDVLYAEATKMYEKLRKQMDRQLV